MLEVEKVETIGDVYLISCGVHAPRKDHATTLCVLGLCMHDAVAAMRKRSEADIFLRVGINTGSVIGGVVGLS